MKPSPHSSRKWLNACSNPIRSMLQTHACKRSTRKLMETRRPPANSTRELSIATYLPNQNPKTNMKSLFGCLCLALEPISLASFLSESSLGGFIQKPLFQKLFLLEPILSESIFSESHLFRNPFFRILCFWNASFGIHSLGAHFFSEFMFWSWAKMKISQSVCPFCVEMVKMSEFIFSEAPIWVFLIFWGCEDVHTSILFLVDGFVCLCVCVSVCLSVCLSVCVCVGVVWQLGCASGILTEHVCGCVSRSSRITTKAEEPSIQFRATTTLRAKTDFIL